MLASRPAELWRYRDLLTNLVLRDLRVKYKGSTLGFAWSLLHPLLMAAVYTLAFRYVLQVRVPHFPVFLLAGLLPWTFLAASLASAGGAVVDNGVLVRKVAFPRAVLPLGAVASQFVQFVLMYVVIIPLAATLGTGLSAALFALVPLALLQLAFTAGLSLAVSAAQVHFRDTQHLVGVILQVWFWLTPIVYPITLVPEAFRGWLRLNPMALFAVAYQDAVLQHTMPSAADTAILTAVAALALVLGLALFRRQEGRFAELV